MSAAVQEGGNGGLMSTFVRHPVAANLLMLCMFIAGLWGSVNLNVQFFPTIETNFIVVSTVWRGASAEDVEEAISTVVEESIDGIEGIVSHDSTSRIGYSLLFIEFEQGWDMSQAQNDINEKLGGIRNLPNSAETPRVSRIAPGEDIANFVVSGDVSLAELRPLAKRYERELRELGFSEVNVTGLPEDNIDIEISREQLEELGLSLDQIGNLVQARAQDFPAGSVGGSLTKRQLRATEKRDSVLGFADLPVISQGGGQMLRLGDIATIRRVAPDGSVLVHHRGNPAVEFGLRRGENENTLEVAETLNAWLEITRGDLPPNIQLEVYAENWVNIKERLSLVLRNGLSGLIIIVLVLFLFLNGRVAFWVMMGIPTSFLATLALMELMGLSINVLTTFALIMALGIIVDDAIVVGEDAVTHLEKGESPVLAAEGGAMRMFWPVVSSSLTTIGAFMPLLIVGGIIGQVMSNIPKVIICVIIASIIECFLILPGHLHHSFLATKGQRSKLREKFDGGFNRLKNGVFRRSVEFSIKYRSIALAGLAGVLFIALSLLGGGVVKFTFFPSPEQSQLKTNVSFIAGTPRDTTREFLEYAEEKLWEVNDELGGKLVKTIVHRSGTAQIAGTPFFRDGTQYGYAHVELFPSDSREIRNEEIIQRWRDKISLPSGLETFTIGSPQAGPPGRDLQIDVTGNSIDVLKQAALELAEEFQRIPGVTGVQDNMPLGREQVIYKLTPTAHALGLTTSAIGIQLLNAFDGKLVQIYQEYGDEVEVRVKLPEAERDVLTSLESMPITTPTGATALLGNLVTFSTERGFDQIRHKNNLLSIETSADVDSTVANSNEIYGYLRSDVLPRLKEKYNVTFKFSGTAKEQADTAQDLMLGAVLGLSLIYITLCWVFKSYGWPFVVMAIIPFGLTGAIFGHYIVGINLTMMSLFGFFGLSGIVVNDSIILVVLYRELKEAGMTTREALIEASVGRFRAVILTSLTTVAGLLPILMETSVNAAFLIPMATTIAFGLAFATILVLFMVPVLLSYYEDLTEYFSKSNTDQAGSSAASSTSQVIAS
jgi:multidrug efflux pump subunit AcrB